MSTLESGDGITIHTLWDDLWKVFRRRKLLILLVTLGAIVGTYVTLQFIDDKYEAGASLIVALGRENVEIPVTVERGNYHTTGVRQEEINSYISVMQGRPLIEEALNELGMERFARVPEVRDSLYKKVKGLAKDVARWAKEQGDELLILTGLRKRLSDREKALMLLERSLKIVREKDSNVIAMSLRLSDPTLAKDFLDLLLKAYFRRHVEILRAASSNIGSAFEEQADSYGKQVVELRQRLSDTRKKAGVSDPIVQRQQLLTTRSQLQNAKLDEERTLAKLESEKALVDNLLATLPPQHELTSRIEPSSEREALLSRLASLKVELAAASARFDKNAEPLRVLREEIASTEDVIAKSPSETQGTRTMGRNPLVDQYTARKEDIRVSSNSLQRSIALLGEQITKLDAELGRIDEAESTMKMLEVEIQVAESRLVMSASRREELRSREALDRTQNTNVILANAPSWSEKPVTPKRTMIMLIAIGGGLVAGIGVALWIEWRSDVLYDESDSEGIPGARFLGFFRTDQDLARTH